MLYKKINPVNGMVGEVEVPGDKSITHRAIMFGSLAEGTTVVERFLPGEDCMSTMSAFRQLGVDILQKDGTLFIHSKGVHGLKEPDDVINLGNSGTSMRLITGILAGMPFFSVLTGDSSLRKRPMKRLIGPLTKMNARIYGRTYSNGMSQNDSYAPLAINGRKLTGTTIELPVASAQLKSAIILAGMFASGWTDVTEPSLSRNHTELMIPAFSGDIFVDGLDYKVQGGQALVGTHINVCGDFSSASFLIVSALISRNSELLIKNVGVNQTRTGLLDVLIDMGGRIEVLNRRKHSGEDVADIRVVSSDLKGIDVGGDVVPRMIDEFPIFCVAAARAEGRTEISGAKELRFKESDRIATMCKELSKLGVSVEELGDGMVIEGKEEFSSGEFNSYGDHRVAMSMAVASLVGKEQSTVLDTACVETSFPGFWDLLSALSN